MNVTETHNHQDGSTSTREIHIPFVKGRSHVAFSLVPETDEPLAIFIIQAGWTDCGPTFHILTEYGDSMQTEYDFRNLSQVYEKYPEFQSIWESRVQDGIVSSEDFISYPNDMELGHLIRSRSINTK